MLTYISGGPQEAAYRAAGKITVNVQILQATADFYVYKTYNRLNGKTTTTTDTLWLAEQPQKLAKKNIIEASFPGGDEAWQAYMSGQMSKHEKELGKSAKEGTCVIAFIVNTDGTITDIKAVNRETSIIARLAIDAIKNGPKWNPGSIDGKPQRMVRYLPITFAFAE